MRSLLWSCILFISFGLLSGMSAINSTETNNYASVNLLPKDSIAARTDSIIRKIAETNHCRVISKISRPGMPNFYSGYDGRKGENLTNFNGLIEIGSCTKMFTATSILQLVEKGKLSLQDKLVDVLPDITAYRALSTIDGKNYMDSVRIFNLLNHSSGFPDYFIDGNNDAEIALHGDSTLRFTYTQLLSLAQKTNKPYFIPGKGFKYSNTNYILLGMIIEKITGMNYSQYIQQYILNPLQMKHTYFGSRNPPENAALGHYKGKRVVMPATLAGPAGDIISDLDDMQTFIRAWHNGILFSRSSTMSVVKNEYYQPMSGNFIKYGLGVLNLLDLSLGHAGQTFGFQFYAGITSNGSSFVLSIDDADVSIWDPAATLSGLLQ